MLWTLRKSAPFINRSVAKLWRIVWGLTCLVMPARRAYLPIIDCTLRVVRRREAAPGVVGVFVSSRAAEQIETYLSARHDSLDPLFISYSRNHGATNTSGDFRRLTTRSVQSMIGKYARGRGGRSRSGRRRGY